MCYSLLQLDVGRGESLAQAVNAIAEMKTCNNTIFLECRKRTDLYMWVGKTPHGPSAKVIIILCLSAILLYFSIVSVVIHVQLCIACQTVHDMRYSHCAAMRRSSIYACNQHFYSVSASIFLETRSAYNARSVVHSCCHCNAALFTLSMSLTYNITCTHLPYHCINNEHNSSM